MHLGDHIGPAFDQAEAVEGGKNARQWNCSQLFRTYPCLGSNGCWNHISSGYHMLGEINDVVLQNYPEMVHNFT